MRRRRYVVWTVLIVVSCVVGGMLIANAPAGPSADAKYIGTGKCRACHMDEYRVWRTTKHSKNFGDLEGDERSNADCIQCHTTGYGEGGFVSEEETPDLTDTGCEACHGPGSLHAEAAKDAEDAGTEGEWDTKYPPYVKNACVKCHKPHISQKKRVEKLREEG
ncbi:hypothetical protein LCGC14_0254360 [marine sediment metagenome]|uniref:Cytochrome c-552/4 domain-containing protein n=1 Tax=marine sediment metagenome TaxID=412755 RepID=A0A0F9U3U3_9ZZZZ